MYLKSHFNILYIETKRKPYLSYECFIIKYLTLQVHLNKLECRGKGHLFQ